MQIKPRKYVCCLQCHEQLVITILFAQYTCPLIYVGSYCNYSKLCTIQMFYLTL